MESQEISEGEIDNFIDLILNNPYKYEGSLLQAFSGNNFFVKCIFLSKFFNTPNSVNQGLHIIIKTIKSDLLTYTKLLEKIKGHITINTDFSSEDLIERMLKGIGMLILFPILNFVRILKFNIDFFIDDIPKIIKKIISFLGSIDTILDNILKGDNFISIEEEIKVSINELIIGIIKDSRKNITENIVTLLFNLILDVFVYLYLGDWGLICPDEGTIESFSESSFQDTEKYKEFISAIYTLRESFIYKLQTMVAKIIIAPLKLLDYMIKNIKSVVHAFSKQIKLQRGGDIDLGAQLHFNTGNQRYKELIEYTPLGDIGQNKENSNKWCKIKGNSTDENLNDKECEYKDYTLVQNICNEKCSTNCESPCYSNTSIKQIKKDIKEKILTCLLPITFELGINPDNISLKQTLLENIPLKQTLLNIINGKEDMGDTHMGKPSILVESILGQAIKGSAIAGNILLSQFSINEKYGLGQMIKSLVSSEININASPEVKKSPEVKFDLIPFDSLENKIEGISTSLINAYKFLLYDYIFLLLYNIYFFYNSDENIKTSMKIIDLLTRYLNGRKYKQDKKTRFLCIKILICEILDDFLNGKMSINHIDKVLGIFDFELEYGLLKTHDFFTTKWSLTKWSLSCDNSFCEYKVFKKALSVFKSQIDFKSLIIFSIIKPVLVPWGVLLPKGKRETIDTPNLGFNTLFSKEESKEYNNFNACIEEPGYFCNKSMLMSELLIQNIPFFKGKANELLIDKSCKTELFKTEFNSGRDINYIINFNTLDNKLISFKKCYLYYNKTTNNLKTYTEFSGDHENKFVFGMNLKPIDRIIIEGNGKKEIYFLGYTLEEYPNRQHSEVYKDVLKYLTLININTDPHAIEKKLSKYTLGGDNTIKNIFNNLLGGKSFNFVFKNTSICNVESDNPPTRITNLDECKEYYYTENGQKYRWRKNEKIGECSKQGFFRTKTCDTKVDEYTISVKFTETWVNVRNALKNNENNENVDKKIYEAKQNESEEIEDLNKVIKDYETEMGTLQNKGENIELDTRKLHRFKNWITSKVNPENNLDAIARDLTAKFDEVSVLGAKQNIRIDDSELMEIKKKEKLDAIDEYFNKIISGKKLNFLLVNNTIFGFDELLYINLSVDIKKKKLLKVVVK
jgi:hypothetical protein